MFRGRVFPVNVILRTPFDHFHRDSPALKSLSSMFALDSLNPAFRGETPGDASPSGVSAVFTDQTNDTFKHEPSGLIWLANPTSLPQPQSLEDAKAIVAQLKSGQYGLSDGSKAGDWMIHRES